MSSFARHLVSQNKKRTVDKTVPGGSMDLDLAQVHERIVCMGFPATGVMALYRNSYDDALRYLDFKYGDGYRVYNLCAEKNFQYSADRFHGRVGFFPFVDHEACPLAYLPAFINDALSWLTGGSDRVVVIHCAAGKARTGIFACCLLMVIEPSLQQSARETMTFYSAQRMKVGEGLTVPSQRRSVMYYERLLNEFGGEVPDTVPTVTINEIRLNRFAPRVSVHWICLENKDKHVCIRVKDVKKGVTTVKSVSSYQVTANGVQENCIAFDCRADPNFQNIRGDVKITFKDGRGAVGLLFFNTLFLHKSYDSSSIDKLKKKISPANPCTVEFDFTVTSGQRAPTPPPSCEQALMSGSGASEDSLIEEVDEESDDAGASSHLSTPPAEHPPQAPQ